MIKSKKIRKAVRRTLPPSSALVFMALSEYIDADFHECTVTKRMLSEDTNLSVRSIEKILKSLESIEAIKITAQFHMSDGGRATNLYKLCLDPKYWEQRTAAFTA